MLVIPRSICELTVTALLAVLFDVFGSLCVAETVGRERQYAAAVGVTVMYA